MKKILAIMVIALLCFANIIPAFATTSETTSKETTSKETVSDGEHIHEFGEWEIIEAPTCTKKGSHKRTCACGEVETEKLDKAEHDWNSGATKPGENGDIIWIFTCRDCRVQMTEIQKIPNIDELISSEVLSIVSSDTSSKVVASDPIPETSSDITSVPSESDTNERLLWILIIIGAILVVGAGAAVTVLFFMNK